MRVAEGPTTSTRMAACQEGAADGDGPEGPVLLGDAVGGAGQAGRVVRVARDPAEEHLAREPGSAEVPVGAAEGHPWRRPQVEGAAAAAVPLSHLYAGAAPVDGVARVAGKGAIKEVGAAEKARYDPAPGSTGQASSLGFDSTARLGTVRFFRPLAETVAAEGRQIGVR